MPDIDIDAIVAKRRERAVQEDAELQAGGFLRNAKATKVLAVEIAYNTALAQGFIWNGSTFALDDQARQNIAAQAVAALGSLQGQSSWAEGDGWMDVDHLLHVMTAQQFWDFAAAVRERVKALIRRQAELKLAIAQADDLATLEAIDTEEGW